MRFGCWRRFCPERSARKVAKAAYTSDSCSWALRGIPAEGEADNPVYSTGYLRRGRLSPYDLEKRDKWYHSDANRYFSHYTKALLTG